MTKEQLKEIIRKSVEEIWYNRRSLDPVIEQTEELTEKIWPDFNKIQQERDQYKEAWLRDLGDAFMQACWIEEEKQYDHMCRSAYEYMQRELIKHGRIQPYECYRR